MIDLDCSLERTLDTIHIHFTCACEYIENLFRKYFEIR